MVEVALHPSDLRVQLYSRILEGQSTAGTEEVPVIPFPANVGPTNRAIQRDQYFYIDIFVHVSGRLARLLSNGSWQTRVLFEKQGGGETSFEPMASAKDLGINGHLYRMRAEVKPGELADGTYEITVELQYFLPDNTAMPIVGFDELGKIKIYSDGF